MSDEIESVWAQRVTKTTVMCPECNHDYVFPKFASDDEIINSVQQCQECGTRFRIYGIEE